MNEAALKEKLKFIAKGKEITFNEVWKQLLLERFLARLSDSEYRDKLVFKGGLLLAQYLKIGRETIDIDLSMNKIKSETHLVQEAMENIISLPLNDGFSFLWDRLEELNQPHMEYTGFRVSLIVKLGNMRDKIQIDIGVGDAVSPKEMDFYPFQYKGKPIFEGEISLLVYPVETIFSEKLETIISKGAINSRMKDYHDLILMMREPEMLNIEALRNSITKTFANRKTNFIPQLEFDDSAIKTLQQLWVNHLRGLGVYKDKLNLPEQFNDAISEINSWLELNQLVR